MRLWKKRTPTATGSTAIPAKTTDESPARAQSRQWDSEAQGLIESLRLARSSFAQKEQLVPTTHEHIERLLKRADECLQNAAKDYRKNLTPKFNFQAAAAAIGFARGLLGLDPKGEYELFGVHVASLDLELRDLSLPETEEGMSRQERLALIAGFRDQAFKSMSEVVRDLEHAWDSLVTWEMSSAQQAVDRAYEALESDSYGARLVGRLEKLNPRNRLRAVA